MTLSERDFREIIKSLFKTKLRSSFNIINSPYDNPHMSRTAYFNDLISMNNHKPYSSNMNNVINYRNIFKKLNTNSTEFSIKFSSIKDNRFRCINSLIKKDLTYPDLKNEILNHNNKSCKSCTMDRHLIIPREQTKIIEKFMPAPCLLNPKHKGLSFTLDIELAPPFTELNFKIKNLSLGKVLFAEYSNELIDEDKIKEIEHLSDLKIRLEIKDLEKVRFSNIKEIWRSQGYRERTNSQLLGKVKSKIDVDLLIPRIIEVKNIIEESWNPGVYSNVSSFMSKKNIKPQVDRKWPLLYLGVNESTWKIINEGIKSTISQLGEGLCQIPFDVSSDIDHSLIEFNMDNLELWR